MCRLSRMRVLTFFVSLCLHVLVVVFLVLWSESTRRSDPVGSAASPFRSAAKMVHEDGIDSRRDQRCA
jgi:hypothetical protein